MPRYRGDCHVHSHLSHGGELTPAQLVAQARAAGLDFLAVTEHNADADLTLWAPHADGLLVVPGREDTGGTGHRLTLGVGHTVRVAAHPHAPYPGGRFVDPLAEVDVVEVWNGAWTSDVPWQADNEAALADWHRALVTDVPTGRWRPAIGNSDAHLSGQIGTPHTVIEAAALTPEAVLDTLRSGTGWIAESAAVDLRFTIDPSGLVTVDVAGVPGGHVTLHTERGLVHRAALPAPVHHRVNAALFVRVEVRHADDRMAALSNPVVLRA
jgi:hypothetical protein